MSTEASFFWAFTHTREGITEPAGSLDAPVKATSIDGTGMQQDGREFLIPASGSVTIYDYDVDGDWDFFLAQIMGGEGFGYYTLTMDSPEDPEEEADMSASGDHEATTNKLGLSCTAPLVLCTRDVKVNAGATDGKIYSITFYNGSSTDALRLKVWGRG